jgi:hypothetical protein
MIGADSSRSGAVAYVDAPVRATVYICQDQAQSGLKAQGKGF